MKHIIPLLSTTVLISAACTAGYAADKRFYVGTGLGYSALDTPSDHVFLIGNSVGNRTVTQTGSEAETGGLGSLFFAGLQLNEHIALETDYVNYAESNYESTQQQYTGNTLDGTNSASLNYSTQSVGLFVKLIYPLSSHIDLSAKLGMDYVTQDVDYTNTAGTPTINIDTSQLTAPKQGSNSYSDVLPAGGVGLSYHFNNTLAASAFVEGFMGKGDLDTDQDAIASAYITGISLTYTFE